MKVDDARLLEGLKSRQEFAYTYLFEAYYRPLYAFAAHYLYDPDAAHDIVQGLFAGFYEKGGHLHFSGSLKSYLFAAVRNRCLNYLRDRKIKDSHHRQMVESHIYSNTLDTFEEGSLLKALEGVLEKMPPGMREVFRLRVEKEYKFKEVAAALNITENTAKVQMNNALRMIRDHLSVVRERLRPLLFLLRRCK